MSPPVDPRDLLAAAAAADLPLAPPRADAVAAGFPGSPAHDFGKIVTRVPVAVATPRDRDELARCVAFLGAQQVPFVARGTAHGSGGQALVDGGVVLDLRGLAAIGAPSPGDDDVVVEAGATWAELCDALRPLSRAPAVLTSNWHTTVGGTLAVGGFGDASHQKGPQVTMVRALEVVTLDGARREVREGDPLFDFSLAGRGQLGIIAAARLATVTRSDDLRARGVVWERLDHFLHDLASFATSAGAEIVRARIAWARGRVRGAVGAFGAGAPRLPPLLGRLGAETRVDYAEAGTEGPNRHWEAPCPALEVVIPWEPADPAGGAARLEALRERVLAAGLAPYLPLGSAVMGTGPGARWPHAPLAPLLAGSSALVVPIRPEVPAAALPRVMPGVKDIARWTYDEGGKLYLVGVEAAEDVDLERQVGPALAPWRELHARYNPGGLMNPGLL